MWGAMEGTAGDTGAVSPSHPPGLTLVLHGLFGVSHGPLHEADGLVHIVLYAVDHGSLRGAGAAERRQRETERDGGGDRHRLRAPKGAGWHPPTLRAWPWYWSAFLVCWLASSTCSAVCITYCSTLSSSPPCGDRRGVTLSRDPVAQSHGAWHSPPVQVLTLPRCTQWLLALHGGDREGLREGPGPPRCGEHPCPPLPAPPGPHGLRCWVAPVPGSPCKGPCAALRGLVPSCVPMEPCAALRATP